VVAFAIGVGPGSIALGSERGHRSAQLGCRLADALEIRTERLELTPDYLELRANFPGFGFGAMGTLRFGRRTALRAGLFPFRGLGPGIGGIPFLLGAGELVAGGLEAGAQLRRGCFCLCPVLLGGRADLGKFLFQGLPCTPGSE
jgi:hypothetical protein